MLKRILLAVLLAFPGFAAAATCQTFAAGDTGYIAKLNLLVAGCTPTGGSAAISPLTTKGDVWGYSSLNARIPVGTNGQVLTADSAQTLGLKWATPSSSGLTATYVGYGDGSNALTGTSDLTYTTASGLLSLSKTQSAATVIQALNGSNGTAAYASLGAQSDGGRINIVKFGSGYTTAGLYAADTGMYNNSTGVMLFHNAAAADFIWARGGSAATNEVARLGAGTLSLGLAGTTQGSLALKGSTSGTATITTDAAAGTPTLTLPTTTGTLAINPMTTGGDLVYGGASGAPTRLANGSAGQVLTSAGTTVAPTWASAPAPSFRGARVYRNAALSLSNGSGTAIAFDAELFDSNSLHDNTTNNSRIVLDKVGKWHVGGAIAFATSNTTGTRAVTIQLNGALVASAGAPPSGTTGTSVFISDIVDATAITDYVELRGYQNSGGSAALDVGTAPNYTYLFATYIGP